eukprot:m.448908 g.448908  ORF g.448908 m.448908 type:complete len:107 (-) comp19734_c0_seq1:49-369(-)
MGQIDRVEIGREQQFNVHFNSDHTAMHIPPSSGRQCSPERNPSIRILIWKGGVKGLCCAWDLVLMSVVLEIALKASHSLWQRLLKFVRYSNKIRSCPYHADTGRVH